MRIAVFIKNTTLHKNYGGFETQNEILCKGLVSRGHEVVVFSPKKNIEDNEKVIDGVFYVFVPCIFKKFSVLYFWAKNTWNKLSYKYFWDYHNEKSFDLVISQSSWGLGIIKNKQYLSVPIMGIAHGSKIGEIKTRVSSLKSFKDYLRFLIDLPHVVKNFFFTQRDFVHGCDHIVAVSNFVKEQIIKETFVEDSKVSVIHNGIDGTKFYSERNALNDDAPLNILYLGRVIRDKGVFVLVDAIKKLHSENITLTIVGDGEDLADLKRYISESSLDGEVSLAGKIPYNDVPSYFSQADIFVLPSLRVEGFPMVLVEAMLAGLPIITTDMGGNSEAVVDGETGFVIAPNDVNALQDRISFFINNKDKCLSFGLAGRDKALKEFSLRVMLDRYENIATSL